MNASIAENPENVFSALQCVQRALQISVDAISTMTVATSSVGTVRMTAPHSLYFMSLDRRALGQPGSRSNPLP